MRNDMNRLLVNGGRPGHQAVFKGRRVKLLAPDEPLEVGRAPIRPVQRGWNEHGANLRTAPLNRFLIARIGRPWNEVYAEASAQFVPAMSRSVREWLLENVSQGVYHNASNELVFGTKYCGVQAVAYNDFYVDPDTELLCATKRREFSRIARNERQAQRKLEETLNRRVFSGTLQYHKRDGIWYEVTLTHLDNFVGETQYSLPWDSLLKRYAGHSSSAKDAYGEYALYSHSHRALNHKELLRLNLA